MSHLSILPTVLTDLEGLAAALEAEGYSVSRNGTVATLASGVLLVDLVASRHGRPCFAWRRPAPEQPLDLVTDLQRQVWSAATQLRLRKILRRYALIQALNSVDARAVVSVD